MKKKKRSNIVLSKNRRLKKIRRLLLLTLLFCQPLNWLQKSDFTLHSVLMFNVCSKFRFSSIKKSSTAL